MALRAFYLGFGMVAAGLQRPQATCGPQGPAAVQVKNVKAEFAGRRPNFAGRRQIFAGRRPHFAGRIGLWTEYFTFM